MGLFRKYAKLNLKKTLQYRKSFIMSLLSQVFIFFTYYFVILALFDKFDNVSSYTVHEILLAFSVIQFGFSVNEVFARGIDCFDRLIIQGEFDRILVRPRKILIQVLGYEMNFAKGARVIQAIIILVIALTNLNIDWNIYRVITLIFMLLSSILIFFGIFLVSAAYCFVTLEGLEVRNLVTDGGKHMAQYPIGIFNKGFRLFFTFVIPYAFVNYYPLLYFIGRNDNPWYCLSPLIIILFLLPCFIIFNKLSKRYVGAGS